MTASEFIEESVAGVAGGIILVMAISIAAIACLIYFVLSSIVTMIEAITQ